MIQVLGVVRAQSTKRWAAEALLRIEALELGAEAVVDVRAERLPGATNATHHLCGTAIQLVDRRGVSAVWLRWCVSDAKRMWGWLVGSAFGLWVFWMIPRSPTHLKDLAGEPLLFLVVGTMFVILTEGLPIALMSLMIVTRRPFVLMSTGVALLISSLLFFFFWGAVVVISVLSGHWLFTSFAVANPLLVAIASVKVSVARQCFRNLRLLEAKVPDCLGPDRAVRNVLNCLLVGVSIIYFVGVVGVLAMSVCSLISSSIYDVRP